MRSKLTILDSIVNTYSLRALEKQKVIKQIQYKSMDEYAKETSIEFFKWNDQYLIDIDPNNQGTVLKMQFYQMSIEERYNLFIKSIEDAKEKV